MLPTRPSRHDFPLLERRPIRILLDGVYYLPNIGTIFRLCDAFRIDRLYVCGFDLELHKRRLVKAASGTLPWVPWAHADAAAAARESQAAGYSIVSVELGEGSVPPQRMRSEKPLCIVLGAERKGVSPELLALSDQLVEIPTDGIGKSINLSTAAAIVMYEAATRFPLVAPKAPPAAR